MKMKLPSDMCPSDEEGSTLSAEASPFHPKASVEPMIAIYNDGVPTMTCESNRSDILHGIEDQALDEHFPPDAEEAYELEAAEAFVCEMANLAMLEEREERYRENFSCFQKRWEVRRAEGPSGRPKPAMHLIVPVVHQAKLSKNRSLVPHSRAQSHRMMALARESNMAMQTESRRMNALVRR